MSEAAARQETYLPGPDEGRVAQVHDFLTARERAGRGTPDVQCFLSGTRPDDRVELPVELYQVLRQVVDALRNGLAVTVAPVTKTLTTQQAAELLGVSRPTVIRLLDDDKIPFERTGTHRRILLRDLLAYRDRRRAEQYAALSATTVDIEDDLDETLHRLRAARRTVAERRRSSSGSDSRS
ncbi:helix-turn-helix domain-containing protein [Actinokineospora iranica]|uniref:DNA binding domain-containing protein, excisionase family n=1 Tax=Actinokineospora iranica TaxID=1271860 RepID=A0A1G6TE98_9PSEU|nr:helix-turn-helix domain-containing protein [Actinokineospora iranica]SDD27482.1 DNA binding domain-containing protein, excisionase family [Actinokineospora iranica]